LEQGGNCPASGEVIHAKPFWEDRMFRKILLYGLPVYLYGLELLLKAIAAVGSESLIGPTLAGAGIGFLLPLTDLKPVQLPDRLKEAVSKKHARAYYESDKILVECVWVFFFASLVAWIFSVFWSFPQQQQQQHQFSISHSYPFLPHSYSWPVIIGCAVFAVSLLLSEIKERIGGQD
jgi:hypothetical protein